VNKFIKGQQEHGGDIRDRKLDDELYQEQIDTFWYNAARYWKDASLDAIDQKVFGGKKT
jgi:hypothetical protein